MIENLKKTEIFKDLQDEELNEIAPYIREKSFMKREMIFSEGDPPDFLYIVKDGKVKVTKLSHEGKEIILEIISPYDFLDRKSVV